jgi:hypothetical protein
MNKALIMLFVVGGLFLLLLSAGYLTSQGMAQDGAVYFAKPGGTGENQFHSIYDVYPGVSVPEGQTPASYCAGLPHTGNFFVNNYETCQYSEAATKRFVEHLEIRGCESKNTCVYVGIVECQGGILSSYQAEMEAAYSSYCGTAAAGGGSASPSGTVASVNQNAVHSAASKAQLDFTASLNKFVQDIIDFIRNLLR